MWSANGDPLATVNTSIGSADRMQQILCVTFSEAREWDQQNVVITGSTDGVVRCWSMEYVQTPIEKDESKDSMETKDNDNNDSIDKKSSLEEPNPMAVSMEMTKAELIKQMSLTQEEGMFKCKINI